MEGNLLADFTRKDPRVSVILEIVLELLLRRKIRIPSTKTLVLPMNYR